MWNPLRVPRQKKSERTRALVFETALRLFRERGFDETSMRDIADAAGLSLGAAYYYFRSKEEIVLHYYRLVEERSAVEEERLRAGAKTLRERLAVAFETKLGAVHRDRRIFGALLRHVADPASPIGLFSRETAEVRDSAIDTFRRAVAPELATMPPSAQQLLPPALWAAYLAMLLYLFHDRSRGHARTDALVAQVVELLAGVIPMLSLPFAAPFLDRLVALASNAALVPKR